MMRSLFRAASLALVAGVLAVAPAEAQLGGLGNRLKNKVKDAAENAVGGSAASAAGGSTAAGPRYSENVLEITAAVLGKARAVAAVEAQARQHRASGTAYEACLKAESDQATQAFQSLAQRYQAAALAGDANAAQAKADSLEVFQKQALGGFQAKCGPPPTQGSHADAGSARQEALKQNGLTDVQYSVLKERIVFFCRSEQAATANGETRLPGDGRNIFYVYGAGEVDALKPACADLLPQFGEG